VRANITVNSLRKLCADAGWFKSHLLKAIDDNKLLESDGFIHCVT
jgi:hypothetical protein